MPTEPSNIPNWKTLVVVDVQILRDAVRCLATQFIGDSDECSDGDEAVARFSEAFESDKPYDLILLDIEMPKMDGTDVVDKIREIEEKASIRKEQRVKIVLITGYPDEDQIKEWFTKGHDGYLVKPISKDSLLTEIERLRA